MKISIVMATYNGEKYIHEQIQSIMKQSKLPDEIVVNDDCSKDNTIEIIRKYAKEYPLIDWKINVNELNLGYVKNFFNAINRSSGDIIILSDQDDVWAENKISIIHSFFESHPDMISLHMDYSVIDKDGNMIREHEIKYNSHLEKYSVCQFTRRLNYCGMSSAFRNTVKSYLNEIEVDKLPTHDWTIHAIAVLKGGMYVSKDVVSYRRAHGDNVALNIEKKVRRMGIEQRLRVVKDYYDYYVLFGKIREIVMRSSDEIYISRLIATQKRRIEYLNEKKLIAWLLEIRNINYFPSAKAYFCDMLYIAKIY